MDLKNGIKMVNVIAMTLIIKVVKETCLRLFGQMDQVSGGLMENVIAKETYRRLFGQMEHASGGKMEKELSNNITI
jgi:hypothetical protein